jgi:predicted transcriptional regulator
MSTFTSTLPDEVLKQLANYAEKLSVPKNKLIERALVMYLEHLKRAEYARSYRQMAEDTELMKIAEEGMSDYLRDIES